MADQTGERKQWKIDHRDREYAQLLGDPLVAVMAENNQEEAEREAAKGFSLPSGAWAVEERRKAQEPSHERELSIKRTL